MLKISQESIRKFIILKIYCVKNLREKFNNLVVQLLKNV